MHHDVEQARFNMIEQQIRPWEVLDGTVLDLLSRVPREQFVPDQYRGLAFADIEIPIGAGQTMLSPKMEGRILQALAIQPTDKVLEIGTGSGYFTALLASLAHEVHSIEINAELSRQAHEKLVQQGIQNVTLHVGDGVNTWHGNDTYDVIVFTGSLALPPEATQHLRMNGRLFAVIGQPPVMEATLIRRINEESFRQDVIFETCLPPLENAPQPQQFAF
ncbi:protein-L-isoaspartate(D-aspartate) O-methyltransferase [Methylobacillus rhizosphaerae]|uniref:Protein-L-isoaspartate O-methyltransferase n=1 Tax=Methylobacillus rhizosphaerae TaxID=551994 RepID=A0A238ZAW1_9PROT|nr:protein-L-isoaspartate O-methyltransferase [Methylobacillus rhizosphaerae]SNR80212.1 protein-L-isoaspartate(D-aspartate) O-methyltransferase [Methylobacillus rhizosphaerae]